ncbi:MAG TPA: nitrilase-related carbon-nitrogen hydrolase [Jatrophihabitans sp.]|jgi:predicted amidohydrolase|uniref:nitrilase-related carbon-nitrogen hydrolase n=1 Tax=Jatrophihabitans sp. TaxID=1932789 RepID=UPI002EE1FFA7
MMVAAIQHDIVWEDGPATQARLEPLIAQAASGGARLIAVSEMYATGFSMRQERVAEQPGGPNERFLIEQAQRHNTWLIGSIAQWAGPEGDTLAANVAVLAGPEGEVFRYDKMHPFTYAGEHEHYRAGKDFLTVDVEGLRVSVFICYDLRFADEFWAVADDTDLYIVLANWPEPRREHWRTLLRARAIENQAYVLGCNRVGQADKLNYLGDSAIIDPMGQALVEASRAETVLMVDVDPAQVRQVRERFPFLADRR